MLNRVIADTLWLINRGVFSLVNQTRVKTCPERRSKECIIESGRLLYNRPARPLRPPKPTTEAGAVLARRQTQSAGVAQGNTRARQRARGGLNRRGRHTG